MRSCLGDDSSEGEEPVGEGSFLSFCSFGICYSEHSSKEAWYLKWLCSTLWLWGIVLYCIE